MWQGEPFKAVGKHQVSGSFQGSNKSEPRTRGGVLAFPLAAICGTFRLAICAPFEKLHWSHLIYNSCDCRAKGTVWSDRQESAAFWGLSSSWSSS